MGYNSTIVVLNDALHMIEQDPDFGKKIGDAIRGLSLGRQQNIYASTPQGGSSSAATAVETHHADGTAVVAVGGNCATVLGETFSTFHHGDEETQIRILQQLAEKHGYTLSKKRK